MRFHRLIHDINKQKKDKKKNTSEYGLSLNKHKYSSLKDNF